MHLITVKLQGEAVIQPWKKKGELDAPRAASSTGSRREKLGGERASLPEELLPGLPQPEEQQESHKGPLNPSHSPWSPLFPSRSSEGAAGLVPGLLLPDTAVTAEGHSQPRVSPHTAGVGMGAKELKPGPRGCVSARHLSGEEM